MLITLYLYKKIKYKYTRTIQKLSTPIVTKFLIDIELCF